MAETVDQQAIIVSSRYSKAFTGALMNAADVARATIPGFEVDDRAAARRINTHVAPYRQHVSAGNAWGGKQEAPESTFELGFLDTSLVITGFRAQANSIEQSYLNLTHKASKVYMEKGEKLFHRRITGQLYAVAKLTAAVLLQKEMSDDEVKELLEPREIQIKAMRRVTLTDYAQISWAENDVRELNHMADCVDYHMTRAEKYGPQLLPIDIARWQPEA